MQATVDAFGGLDIMVNNAGIEIVKPLFHHTEEEFDAIYNINVKGVWLGMQAALAASAPAGRRHRQHVVAGRSRRGSAVRRLLGLARPAWCSSPGRRPPSCEPTGIRINAVCPAFVGTAMVDRLKPIVTEIVGVPFDDLAAMKQGRLGTPEEVAEMVAFLASDESSWCTGGAYVLDGGLQAGML